ncbi:MAG: hypothetical protein WBD95_20760 [Xanthobacteraceae bacterium]
MSESVDFINGLSPDAVAPHPAAGVAVANCYFLLSDAYKRHRGMQDSRTHKYKVAALTAATIMALRPIRISSAVVVSTQVAFANQQCAMRATQALLGLDLERLDGDFIRRLYASVLDRIELPCLAKYLAAFETAFTPPRQVTFAEVENALPFDHHNDLVLNAEELASIEGLTNQFATLEAAYGHPFLRILFGWARWWS